MNYSLSKQDLDTLIRACHVRRRVLLRARRKRELSLVEQEALTRVRLEIDTLEQLEYDAEIL